VVKDERYGYGLGSGASVYRPARREGHRMLTIVARTSGDATIVAAMMKREAQRLDPKLVIHSPETIDSLLHNRIASSRFHTTLFAIFAGLGMVLTGIGTYGVTSHWVRGRTREIGIRIALGAEPLGIRRLVLIEAGGPVLAGIAVGFAGALVLTRQLQHLLYEITPHDPLTLICAAMTLCAVAMAAAYIPARSASEVDPVVALKAD
jgi:ABC-type antimicrobial peptide transport system permease subunit